MTNAPMPSVRDLVRRLKNLPLKDVGTILELVATIEQVDRDTAFLRRVQAARNVSKVAALEKLRIALHGTADYETANLIVSRLEATCAPAYAPSRAGNVTVQRRTAFNF